jgi:hypothetical protein
MLLDDDVMAKRKPSPEPSPADGVSRARDLRAATILGTP